MTQKTYLTGMTGVKNKTHLVLGSLPFCGYYCSLINRKMNYLEQLVSEWYQYQGCFVKTNVRITNGKTKSVRHELDVMAYNYKTNECFHVEATTSTHKSGDGRRIDRFKNANYKGIFGGINLPKKITKRVIFLHNRSDITIYDKNGICALNMLQFLNEINAVLKEKSIGSDIVPESFPLIRTIQIVLKAQKGEG